MLKARSTVMARPLAGKNIRVTAAVKHEQEVQLNYLTKPLRKEDIVIPSITVRLLARGAKPTSCVDAATAVESTTLLLP